MTDKDQAYNRNAEILAKAALRPLAEALKLEAELEKATLMGCCAPHPHAFGIPGSDILRLLFTRLAFIGFEEESNKKAIYRAMRRELRFLQHCIKHALVTLKKLELDSQIDMIMLSRKLDAVGDQNKA